MSSNSQKTTITKQRLVHAISKEHQIDPKETLQIIQAFLDKVTESLGKGSRLEFREFGVFQVVERKKKIGRNPKNASVPIVIPARMAVKFTPGKKMERTTMMMKLNHN